VRVDFTNVSDGSFAPLPEGNYEATVFQVEQKVGKDSGKPYLNWQFKIQGGEFDGRRAFYMTSLSPGALWKLKQVLKNLGYTDEQLGGEFELDLSDLPGLECVVVITHEQYQGETRDRVTDVLPAGTASVGDTPLLR
jgi:hypothetical protein